MDMQRTETPRFSVKTHMGLVRSVNEDAILALPGLGLWAVADGMGGHHGGDFASQTVIDALADLPLDLHPTDIVKEARAALMKAHADIQIEADLRGGTTIGTTVVLLAIAEAHFLCLWAGDSRLYHYRKNQLNMVSIDHSVVGELVQAGQMSWDEAEQHSRSNEITRAVGFGEVLDLDKRRGEIEPGDRFILCSDGLTKYANHETMRHLVQTCGIETLAEELIRIALDGGAADNTSVIAIEV